MKYLSPFAPDISGATAVLFGMKGLIVIIDAGGCTGNVCGFDEPRWKMEKSAIFSAGLRDLDAILGRDEAMMRKVGDVLGIMDGAEFLALVGTPVPSVIATDYQALKRMGQRKFGIRTLTIPTTGMELYDKGQERAYLELLREYRSSDSMTVDGNNSECPLSEGVTMDAGDSAESGSGALGILGATPMDLLESDTVEMLRERVSGCGGSDVRVYGEDVGDFAFAPHFRENLVISPSGLAPAKYLEEKYGVTYCVRYPLPDAFADYLLGDIDSGKLLIVHQAVLAETLRVEIEKARPFVRCDTATFFMPFGNSTALREEDDFIELVRDGGYDAVIGDPLLERAVSRSKMRFISLPHFAVSGEPM